MHEGGGWSPKSLAHKSPAPQRHMTLPKPQDRRESALSAVVGRRAPQSAGSATVHPARPRLARRYYGRDRAAKVVVGKGG